jgi:hypothetical protein
MLEFKNFGDFYSYLNICLRLSSWSTGSWNVTGTISMKFVPNSMLLGVFNDDYLKSLLISLINVPFKYEDVVYLGRLNSDTLWLEPV